MRFPPQTRLVYVSPSHQFPLGMSMSLQRRLALLEWARRADAAIIEDDYDGEFRFSGRPLEPLHALDGGCRVIYVGSFSKTMLPSLRLGFLIAPHSLRDALTSAKFLADWSSLWRPRQRWRDSSKMGSSRGTSGGCERPMRRVIDSSSTSWPESSQANCRSCRRPSACMLRRSRATYQSNESMTCCDVRQRLEWSARRCRCTPSASAAWLDSYSATGRSPASG